MRAGGGVNGLGGRKAFEIPELVEGLDNFLGVGQDGDEVGLEAGAGSLTGFELAVEEEGGIGEFFPREAEGGAKEDLGRPAPGQGHEAHAFLEVAVAGQEFESCLDEGFWIQRDEIGLVAVDALVVSGVERAGFFWLEREIAEALTGAHFSWAQDQVIGLHGADRVAVLGECELDGGQGVTGFEPSYFGLAESVKFLEGQGASAAVCGEIGRESSDALEEVLGSDTEIEDHRFLRLSAARLGEGAPGSGLVRILGHCGVAVFGFRQEGIRFCLGEVLDKSVPLLKRPFHELTAAFGGFVALAVS